MGILAQKGVGNGFSSPIQYKPNSLWNDSSRGVLSDASAHFASANKEYLTIPSNSSLQTGDIDFEIGGWVRLDSVGTDQALFNKWNSNIEGEFRIYVAASGKVIYSTSNKAVSSNETLSANTWYYIRAWRENSTKKIRISVNNGAYAEDTDSGNYTTTQPIVFGSSFTNSVRDKFFNGRLDSWYFQKRISTSAEATALYNSGRGRTYNDLTAANGLDTFKSGLTSWWDFNEEGGTRYDAKGSNHLTSAADPIIQPPVYGSELLSNGGFETVSGNDFGSWVEQGSVADETTIVHSGSHAVKLTKTSVFDRIGQAVNVSAGKTYLFSIWTRGDGTNSGNVYAQYKDGDFATALSYVSTGVTGNTYTLKTYQITAKTGYTSIYFYCYSPETTGGIAYFDDVSVKEIVTPSINNGGFEDWTTATNAAVWTEFPTDSSTVNQEVTAPYAGNYSAILNSVLAGGAEIDNVTALVVGKKYTLTCYAKSASGTPTLKMYFGNSGNLTTMNNTVTTTWAQYTFNGSAGSSYLAIVNNTASSSIYIDNVTLTSLGPTADAGIAAGIATDGNFGARFNGSNQYLSKASNASLQAGDIDFEVGAWVYFDNLDKDYRGIISKTSGSTSAGIEYSLYYQKSSGKLIFAVSDGLVSKFAVASSYGTVPINQYLYVRCWHNSINDTVNIQVNNGVVDSVSTAGISPQSTTNAFQIGRTFGSDTYIQSGRIDSAYKLNRILTTDEATALYNNGKGLKYAQLPSSIKNDSALKGYWNLDEKSGTRYDSTSNHNDLTDNGTVSQVQGVNYYEGTVSSISDLSGNNNTFSQSTLSKRPTYSQFGINNKPAMLFDGVDDTLVATGDKIGTGDVTVTAVFKARGWGGGGGGRIIENHAFNIRTTNYNSNNCISVYNGNLDSYSANSSISFNTSYIVTVTRTSAGIVNIYINGMLSGTANQNSGTPVAGSDTYIGNRAAGDRAFDGWIGSVFIFNSILSSGQRQSVERYLAQQYSITLS